jgi:flagellin-like hook-associated protein FlgL
MYINTNMDALVAANAYASASAAVATASERISSQLRINSAKDDPAGLGIANRLSANMPRLLTTLTKVFLRYPQRIRLCPRFKLFSPQ